MFQSYKNMDHVTVLGIVKTTFQSKKNLNIQRLLQPGPAHWCHCSHHCQVPLPQCSPHLYLVVVQQEGDYHHQLPGRDNAPTQPSCHGLLCTIWLQMFGCFS